MRLRRPRVRRALSAATVVSLTVTLSYAHHGESARGATTASPNGASAVIAAPLPGSIVSLNPLERIAREIDDVSSEASRIVYRSADTRNHRIVNVSGAFFIPRGDPPPDGWPVVAVGHPGYGIDIACAPSLTTTLLGQSRLVADLLRAGYAVTVSDYAGLGTPDVDHDYLDIAGAGRNLIDSVRALRGAYPGVSARWVAFGRAQGGGAAWTANQQARLYAPELDLLGTVAVSPTTDLTPLVDEAEKGALNHDQREAMLWMLASLRRQHSDLNLDEYRHGVAAAEWRSLTACSGNEVHRANVAARNIGAFDLAPSSPTAARRLRDLVSGYAVTDQPLSAPMSVLFGTDGALTEPRWSSEAINSACLSGGTVAWYTRFAPAPRGADSRDEIAWLTDRFAGRATANDCVTASRSDAGAGALHLVEELPDVAATRPAGARGVRILYGSTDGDTGSPTIVSGTAFSPGGPTPPGGWPVLAFAHGTLGIDESCGPSVPRNLPLLMPIVHALLDLGFAVAFADYEGLGAPGTHPYLDSRTAGLNVIDSVRALRAAIPDVSTRWAAFGHSQGGAAAWAAAEQAGSYAPELDLVGAVALAPPADVSGIVDRAMRGALTTEQIASIQMIATSMTRLDPSLDANAFRRGPAVSNWDILASCTVPTAVRDAALSQLRPADVAPDGDASADGLRRSLQRWALPQRQVSAPLSVVYGADDRYIDAQWTTDAIGRACALGNLMRVRLEPHSGHSDIDWMSELRWILDRFANKPVTNDCREQVR